MSATPASPPPTSPRSAASAGSASRSWFGSADPEELRARAEHAERVRAAAAAQRVERAALIARRDVLAYFDTLLLLGPFVYIDTVPPAMIAVLTVTVGSVALFMDGGGTLTDSGGACGGTLHFFVLALIGASFALLGLLSYVIMGYRVSIDINMPFQALVGIMSALGAIWFFFGLPVFLVWVVQLVTAAGALPPCFRLQPLLFGAQRAARPRARARCCSILTPSTNCLPIPQALSCSS